MKIINSDNLSRPAADLNYKSVRSYIYNEENSNVTVIVQAFGRLDKTRKCVESILKYTTRDYELVLMDNGTTDNEILDYFESVNYSKKSVLRFTKNITGVYAINKTFHQIDSKYVVMVNNDIIVTPNWLENLIECAESDKSIGMVVPSSTNVSNYQFECLGGFSSEEEMQEKAAEFNVSNPLKWEEKIRLIPTATLYRREVFDIVGLYDLGFMHDFGDDDYTFRVRRAGYKLMLCRDTFVHHDHDQTALPQERIDIMNQSRKYFEEKYKGIDAWDDTGNSVELALEHVKLKNQDISILALDVKCGTPILEMKNFCRKNSVLVSDITAYTTESKYYIDLQSASDSVKCGDIEQNIKDEENKYDVIILGNPVNYYNKPVELLKNLIKLKKENGYLIFGVKNTSDLASFLSTLNIYIEDKRLCPRQMKYNDILNEIVDYGIRNADVNYTVHNINDDLKKSILNLVYSMNINGDKDEVLQNLFIDNYWITLS